MLLSGKKEQKVTGLKRIVSLSDSLAIDGTLTSSVV
jgi:hypothetical protein